MSARGRPPAVRGARTPSPQSPLGNSAANGPPSPSPAASGGDVSAGSKTLDKRPEDGPSAAAAAFDDADSPPRKPVLDVGGDVTPKSSRKSKKHRRPKFQDNPSAPEIVEKKALKQSSPTTSSPSLSTSPSPSVNSGVSPEVASDKVATNGHTPHDEAEETTPSGDDVTNEGSSVVVSGLLGEMVDNVESKSEEMEEDTTSPASAIDKALENGGDENPVETLLEHFKVAVKHETEADKLKAKLCSIVKELSPARSVVEKALRQLQAGESVGNAVLTSYDRHRETPSSEDTLKTESDTNNHRETDEAVIDIVPLEKLDKNMVPVTSVEIEDMTGSDLVIETVTLEEHNKEMQEVATAREASNKIDKTRLFSQMEDNFAKDTQQALKHKPVYKKRQKEEGKSNAVELKDELKDVGIKDEEEEDAEEANTNSTSDRCHSSSDLTKSLRQVRVRRSRESSLHDGDQINGTTQSEDSEQQSISVKKSLSPKRPRHLSEPPAISSSPASSPLKIHIPDPPEDNSTVVSPPNPFNRRSLLMTPSGMSGAARRRPRRSLNSTLSVCVSVLSEVDAQSIAMAVMPESDDATTSPHQSLKTVIRLPKSANNPMSTAATTCLHQRKKTGRRKAEEDLEDLYTEDNHQPHQKKRKRFFNADQHSSSVSPGQQDWQQSTSIFDMENISGDEAMDLGQQQQHTTSVTPSSSVRTRTPESPHFESNSALAESMVVPEKASSFAVHPERMCSDTCKMCGTKFGSLDTPLHVQQSKKAHAAVAAAAELGVAADACLCDKCHRHITRNRSGSAADKRKKAATAENKRSACLITTCNREVTSEINKKWLIRLKKKLVRKVNLNWERVAKGSNKTLFPLCNKHHSIIKSFSVCGLCKNKLEIGGICSTNLNAETIEKLNAKLREEKMPVELAESDLLCKLCKPFVVIKSRMLSDPDYLKKHKQQRTFLKEQKKSVLSRIQHHLGLSEEMLSDAGASHHLATPLHGATGTISGGNGAAVASIGAGGASPKKIHQVCQSNDTKITIRATTYDPNATSGGCNPSAATVSSSGEKKGKSGRRTKEFASPNADARIQVVEPAPAHSAADSNAVDSNQVHASSSSSASCTSKGSTSFSSSAVTVDPLDKCQVTIQFDTNTKKLWQELHNPYGNYTSFFRHLILLEKYWRNGDLTLSDSASQKASVYIKSVKNRIDGYEGKHQRSQYDLSTCTRPDLDVPAAPVMLHLPDDDEVTRNEDANSSKEGDSTILKIPKVSMPETTSSVTAPSSSSSSVSPAVSPGMPTKIRVRTDLMHIGLMSKHEPNLMEGAKKDKAKKDSFNIADLMAKSSTSPSSTQQSNLLQLLNDPPRSQQNAGPLLGNTSLVSTTSSSKKAAAVPSATTQSSNSQLFKNSSSGGGDSGSSAIPLTFNNSIAEVLAAASKAQKQKDLAAMQQHLAAATAATAPPEVTITAKPASKPTETVKQTHPVPPTKRTSQQAAAAAAEMNLVAQAMWTAEEERSRAAAAAKLMASSTSPRPQQKTPTKPKSSLNSSTGVSNISSIHPLMDMNKLLQSQNPGVPPHIVAQSNLPAASGSTSSSHHLKAIAPKPPGPLPSQIRPVQLGKSVPQSSQPQQGIQTVNKKSLNTVLDRLSGFKGPAPTPASSSTPRNGSALSKSVSSSSSSSAVSSSLLQQLQAPPIASMTPHSKSSTKSSSSSSSRLFSSLTSPTGSNAASSSNNAAALAALASSTSPTLNPYAGLAGFGATAGTSAGQLVGQPSMVQYSSWQGLNQTQAAQAALLMAGAAAMPGMNSVQTVAAMQELMKLSMQQQQQQQQPRGANLRAPPPLTHMGRNAGAGGGGPKPKSD